MSMTLLEAEKLMRSAFSGKRVEVQTKGLERALRWLLHKPKYRWEHPLESIIVDIAVLDRILFNGVEGKPLFYTHTPAIEEEREDAQPT